MFKDQPLKARVFMRQDDMDVGAGKNLERIKSVLAVPRLHFGKQCHGVAIIEVTPESAPEVGSCDALMTNSPGSALLIKHADCQAAIFYDPRHHALAAVHSGWRGSVQNIYAKTVSAMQERYSSRPEELLVAISPSLGPEAAEFRNFRDELPEHFWEFQVKPTYFDFWAISRMQLQASGVTQVEIAGICTYSNPLSCYSYRRGEVTGRHATVAALN